MEVYVYVPQNMNKNKNIRMIISKDIYNLNNSLLCVKIKGIQT